MDIWKSRGPPNPRVLSPISAETTYRILPFWGYKTLVKVMVKKNTKFHGHRIISFENIEIFFLKKLYARGISEKSYKTGLE